VTCGDRVKLRIGPLWPEVFSAASISIPQWAEPKQKRCSDNILAIKRLNCRANSDYKNRIYTLFGTLEITEATNSHQEAVSSGYKISDQISLKIMLY
jgi:hypothetical protein